MKYAIIGGDKRFAYLAGLLGEDGEIATFGLSKVIIADKYEKDSVKEAIQGADVVILPLPVLNKSGKVNTPLGGVDIDLEDVLNEIKAGQTVLLGKPDDLVREAFLKKGIDFTDYYDREELTVKSADATAEAVIEIIIHEMEEKINGMDILVIGFGRIGKLVAYKLRMLGAKVTVSSRKASDKAWTEAYGYETADSGEIIKYVEGKKVLVNTVPEMLLGADRIEKMNNGAVIIDIASKCGYDKEAAKKYKIRAIDAPGLPGRTSPKTAGKDIFMTVKEILREREL